VWRRRPRGRRTASPPVWPIHRSDARPRVLIEHPDPEVQQVLAAGLRRHGYETLTCSGPRGEDGSHTSCPLLRHAPCGGVTGADIVLAALPCSDADERLILRRLTQDEPRPAVLLGPVTERSAAQLEDVLIDGLVTELSLEAVLQALDRALPPSPPGGP
jgi:CheY-like chemotaxis protein